MISRSERSKIIARSAAEIENATAGHSGRKVLEMVRQGATTRRVGVFPRTRLVELPGPIFALQGLDGFHGRFPEFVIDLSTGRSQTPFGATKPLKDTSSTHARARVSF